MTNKAGTQAADCVLDDLGPLNLSPRKASIEASLEMGVPAFALPGEEVWAMGLHAGTRKRFKAQVIGLRKQFPRIIVKYTASEDGNTNAIALPEMPTAYLCAADVEPKDW